MVDRKKNLALVVLFFFSFIELTLEQQNESPPSSPAEKSALLALRSSLGLRSKDWPIKGDPCLNWNGIRCDNGSVVGINISGFKRTRSGRKNPRFFVDPLVNLTRLASFNASKFLLPGSIPDWFGLRLLTLQVLDLSSCSIVGDIPFSLGNLTNLRILDLSDNSISGTIPASLIQFSSLSILNLSKNRLNGSVPQSFSGNLSSLDISSNFFTGPIPAGIGTVSKLQNLNLSHNGLSSLVPPSLGDIDLLVDLDLSFNELSGSVPPELRGLRKLQNFVIGGNRLTGPLPVDLFDLMSRLQVVVLSHNGFVGGLPNSLWSLPELRVLDLSGNLFSDVLPNSTVNLSVTVAELNVSGNTFYGGLTPLLRRFGVVDLAGNYFEGKVPDFLPINATISNNCLQNATNQRTLSDCAVFYSQKGLTFGDFGQPPGQGKKKSSGLSHKTVIILAAIGGGVAVILIFILLPILVSFCVRKSSQRRTQRGSRGVGPLPAGESSPPPPGAVSINFSNIGSSFSHQQLVDATNEFSDANLIKKGHSGDLFKGVLETGISVVVKRISLESIKSEAYLTELDIFSRIAHPRIVPLMGHCLEDANQKCFVYKSMPNGDLPSSLFWKSLSLTDDGLKSLDWITRLKIATGAAEGLAYLHHDCSPPIVHRDVQASSILLDDKFEVRLGSLSKACVQEVDSHQSKITRLLRLPSSSQQSASGSLTTATCAYDVYCFGKVLLELITGKIGISTYDETQFKEYLDEILPHITTHEKEPVSNILDRSLIVDEDLLEEVWAMSIVARSCLNPTAKRRPLMRHVVQALENPMKVVRADSAGSGRFRASSSRVSSNGGGIFGSWRHSSSDSAATGDHTNQVEGKRSAAASSTQESSQNASSKLNTQDV